MKTVRKRKVIKIDDREIAVYELRVKDIRQLIVDAGQDGDTSLDGDSLRAKLALVCDVLPAEFEEMAPSEIELIVDAVREVNASFLALLEKTGAADAIKDAIRKELIAALPDSSRPAT